MGGSKLPGDEETLDFRIAASWGDADGTTAGESSTGG
jgi:hypothetical protein